MDFPTEFEIPSEDERYKPIPEGNIVTVKLAQRFEDKVPQPLGDFYRGSDKNNNPFMIVPFEVEGGDYGGRKLSLFVSLTNTDKNKNFLAKLYETITGEDLSQGGRINLDQMVDSLKSGLFEVEVKLQYNNPEYNDIKRLVARVGDAEHKDMNVPIDVDDAPVDDGDVPF